MIGETTMQAEKIARHFDLTDKVIVVTGGSRGLGLAMCRAFAEAGATVVISSRKAEGCARAAELIERDTGRACQPRRHEPFKNSFLRQTNEYNLLWLK